MMSAQTCNRTHPSCLDGSQWHSEWFKANLFGNASRTEINKKQRTTTNASLSELFCIQTSLRMFFGGCRMVRMFSEVFGCCRNGRELLFWFRNKITVRIVVQKESVAIASRHALCSRTLLCMTCRDTQTPTDDEPIMNQSAHTLTHKHIHKDTPFKSCVCKCNTLLESQTTRSTCLLFNSWQPHGIHGHPMWSCRSWVISLNFSSSRLRRISNGVMPPWLPSKKCN